MIASLFNNFIFDPLYNGLVFLVGVIPTHDIGIAVILLTIIVRVIIYPLSRRAIETQMAMKKIAPEVEEVKKKYPKNSPEQSRAVFALYKERGVHPFANFGLLLVQLPILFGLYWVFLKAGFPAIKPELLYSFVQVPPAVEMHFLGLVDMGAPHNIVLAALVAASQFLYTRLSMGAPEKKENIEASLSSDMAKSFDVQARYVFPLLFAVVSYFVIAAAPLYWLTSNLFMIGQELVAGKRL